MYLHERRMKILNVQNIILYIVGGFLCTAAMFVLLANYIRYADDIELFHRARSTGESVVGLIFGVVALFVAFVSKWLMSEARFYSGYFEMDLDGYISYESLCEVTGKSIVYTKILLSILRVLYMKGFSFENHNKQYQIVLDSKVCICICRSCGAAIEKRIYFTGICPYCNSSDLNAKVLSNQRFYTISTHMSQGSGDPNFYMGKHIHGKRVAYIWALVICASLSVINFIYSMDRLNVRNDRDYLRKELYSRGHGNYELIKKDLMDDFVFGFMFFLAFAVLTAFMISKMVRINTATNSAFLFSRQKKPFVNREELNKKLKYKKPFRRLRKAQKVGYLVKCTFERHDNKMMVALAKQVVKDRCPSCAAPITDAVYEDYVCKYCGNTILGVVEKAGQ